MVRKGCLWGTIAIFVVSMLVLALPLAALAALSAPLHTPQLIGQVVCPQGSQVELNWVASNPENLNEKTAKVECVDAEGNRSPAAELDGQTFPRAVLLYYPVCLLPLLLGGGVFGLALFLLVHKIRNENHETGSFAS